MLLGIAMLGVVGTLLGALIGGRIHERSAAQRLRVEQLATYRLLQFERLRELYARMASTAEAFRFVLFE